MKNVIVCLATLLSTLFVSAQDNVVLYGYVKSEETQKGLSNAVFRVIADNKDSVNYAVAADGKYSVEMDFDHVYTIKVLSAGLATKCFIIDTRNVPASAREGGFGFEVDVELYKTGNSELLALLAQPMGVAKYDPGADNMLWDMEYTMSVRKKIEAVRKAEKK